jgi:DUF4097 and DUF4098 domain-containing protein YvlB
MLLILLGVIFLLYRFDPMFGLGFLIRRYWPVLVILWGIARLIDHFSAGREGRPRSALLSGGEAALLFLIVLVLGAFVFRDWLRDHVDDLGVEIPSFNQQFSQTIAVPAQTLPPGAHVEITSGRGNITVHAGEGNTLVVNATKSAPGATETAADDRMKRVNVEVAVHGSDVRIHPVNQDTAGMGASVDLDIQVPTTSSVAVDATRGDVQVSGVGGDIDARAENGDIGIHDAAGTVNAELQKGDARIADVRGDLRITGHGDDVEVADVAGNVTIDGAFLGSTHVRNVKKTTQCISPWFDVTTMQITGRMELDPSEIEVSGVNGNARLEAHNKDIDVEDVAGQLDIGNSHGDIKIGYSAPPRANVNVTNDSGDVDLTLPENSAFELSAASRSGDVESDFEGPSLKPANDEESERLDGKFGGSGPQITIATTYGTIHLRKSH